MSTEPQGTSAEPPMSERTPEDQVLRQLWRVVDPELGMNILRLGLVYDVEIQEGDVTVVMTLTTPGCPMARAITEGVHRVVSDLPWVTSTTVRLVWEPRWTPERIHR
jgi:metal-sulfur cluster biosynthetic enzyme